MDATAYAAGERSAFLAAYQQALPSQQALGQLFTAMDELHSRIESEQVAWRDVQQASVRATQAFESQAHRLDTLEYMHLPRLQEKVGLVGYRD